MAEFSDFEALGRWVLSEGLSVGFIDWRLTEATRADAERTVRQAAVADAVRRAQDYADALQCGPVQARGVRDPGLAPQPPRGAMLAGRAVAEQSDIELTPDPILIEEEVHATFVAEPAS
jgi:uncharacterized protein YggE